MFRQILTAVLQQAPNQEAYFPGQNIPAKPLIH